MPRKTPTLLTPTRERILASAARLFQERGYHGAGVVEILTDAGAPKGSMYHHFPEGKEQIALLAVEQTTKDVLSFVERLRAQRVTAAEIVRRLAFFMAKWLHASGFRQGSLLTSIAVGAAPDAPRLHAAIQAGFDAWCAQLAAILVEEGWSASRAKDLSLFAVATLEGGMVLARIGRSERALLVAADAVVRALSGPPSRP